MFLRTGLAPHLQLGMTEADYIADAALAADVAVEVRARLKAEDTKAQTTRRPAARRR